VLAVLAQRVRRACAGSGGVTDAPQYTGYLKRAPRDGWIIGELRDPWGWVIRIEGTRDAEAGGYRLVGRLGERVPPTLRQPAIDDASGITLVFLPEEFLRLKHNVPGPSGKMGGYQQFENWLIAHTDRQTFECRLTSDERDRLERYCREYGPGGPNNRIRAACIPALARLGIMIQQREG
jgi:hypothetical protein